MSDVDVMLTAGSAGPPSTAGDPDIKAMTVLRRGVARTPEVKRTVWFSAAISVLVAIGKLSVPVLIQQVIDRGILGPDGYRPGLVLALSLTTLAVIVTVAVLAPLAEIAMVRGAQESLYQLRRQTFAHIHRLSLGQHSRRARGALLARVTSDIETISRFVEWGAITWAMNGSVIIGAFAVMAVYSWQLTLVALGCMLTVVPAIRWLQVRQLRAYDGVRGAIGNLLTVFNEILSGSDTIRSYGYRATARRRIAEAVDARYRADLRTSRFTAALFTVGDFIGATTVAVVAIAAVEWGDGWGLGVGAVVSFFFLVAIVQSPIGEITEVLEQTQAAIAGWHRVLTLLDEDPDLVEPRDGAQLGPGPLSIAVSDLAAAYDGTVVLTGVDVEVAAGSRVAVVGATGSGKTTFARILCRLMDPAAGEVRIGGIELRHVDRDSRRARIRLVPQDGFLFEATVAENVALGHPGTTRREVETAVTELGLDAWVARLPQGLDTDVGPRGEHLSAGERQLVALIRAQVADPGLLILDEATSSVDPRTEQALAEAMRRVAAGRTVVSIAHRLSTAEQADLVLVFDAGRLVERGAHDELLAAAAPVYTALHESWQRTTSSAATRPDP